MGFPEDFNYLKNKLSKYYDNIITPAFPGHSKKIVAWKDYQLFIEDFYHTYISQETKLDCLGYSMGGRVLLSLLDKDQFSKKIINNVALVSTSFGLQTKKERQERFEKDSKLFNNIIEFRDFELFLKKWAKLPIFKGLTKSEHFDDWIASRMLNDPYELKFAVNLLSVSHMNFYQNNIPIPRNKIIYICGEMDKKYCELSKNINISSFIVPGCSHNVIFQNPKEVVKILIREFNLKKL